MTSDPPPTKTPWIQTPLIESVNLSKAAGCRVFLKLENVQPSGSFKMRGLGNLVTKKYRASPHPEKLHFYSSSGGNAGLAAVHAANFVRRPATVVVPMSTKPAMIEKIRAAGAREVLQHGASWAQADGYLRETVMKRAEAGGEEAVYVPPFDHADVWEGHASMVEEIAQQMGEEGPPDYVVCSCGGGGLFAGIMQGVEQQGFAWKKTSVVVTETEGANALSESLKAGEMVTLPAITSIATSLGAVRVAERPWNYASKGEKDGRVISSVLTDAEAAMGCWRLADDERILVEPACGVSVALCYGRRLDRVLQRQTSPETKVVIVVCGGSNVSTSMIEGWREEYGSQSSQSQR